MPLSTNHPILKYGTSRMKKLKHWMLVLGLRLLFTISVLGILLG
jgi:hypothetical protein